MYMYIYENKRDIQRMSLFIVEFCLAFWCFYIKPSSGLC